MGALDKFLRKARADAAGFSAGLSGGGARHLSTAEILPTGGTGNVRDIAPSLWFSPLQPVPAMAPKDTRPRQWAYPVGSNMVWQPGADNNNSSGFPILRDLADSWDLLRLAIETVKDRLCAVEWEVQVKPKPGEKKKDLELRQGADIRVKQCQDFLDFPDGEHPLSVWKRMLLEDMLVLDAPAVYLERDMQRRIANLRVIDGATINRVITDQGFTPSPPQVAYQQVIYGTPAYDLTTDDLVYSPRNPRAHRKYGYGPVEQMLVTIAIGLRRQKFQLNYYTEGNIPEAMCFLPPTISIDRVKEVQGWFDSILTGDLATRRRLLFLPGYGTEKDAKPNIIFPKEVLLKDEMDNWLWQIVAYGLGTRPEAMMKMVNRASAETSAESTEEEGLEPKIKWMETLFNTILQRKMGFTDLEIKPKQRKETDGLKQAQIDQIYLANKANSINEVRANKGDDPRPEPEADSLEGFKPDPVDFGGAGVDQFGNDINDDPNATPEEKVAEKLLKKKARRRLLLIRTY